MNMESYLRLLSDVKGSDLHLKSGLPPYVRINGSLEPCAGLEIINEKSLKKLIYNVLTQEQIKHFETHPNWKNELDFAFSVKDVGRFRMNVYRQQGQLGLSARALAPTIPSIDDIGLPVVAKEIVQAPCGMVLVTGPTGSGKSTTLAALIDYINESFTKHIISIEDPIEYRFECKRSLITQREVGKNADTMNFSNGLRQSLRQDPDVIMIGEMRDLETVETALMAAETGHLIFGTLHTSSAPKSISRIIDVFPADKQQLIMTQLSNVLEGVIAQLLLPSADKKSRLLCCEIMRANDAVRNGIRTNRIDTLYQTIQTSSNEGMCTMDQALIRSVKRGKILYKDARPHIRHKSSLEQLEELRGRGFGRDTEKKGSIIPVSTTPVPELTSLQAFQAPDLEVI